MSERPSTTEDPSWPTRCEHCGHELVSQTTDVMPGGDEQQDIPIARDVCPNPDCPAHGAGAPG